MEGNFNTMWLNSSQIFDYQRRIETKTGHLNFLLLLSLRWGSFYLKYYVYEHFLKKKFKELSFENYQNRCHVPLVLYENYFLPNIYFNFYRVVG